MESLVELLNHTRETLPSGFWVGRFVHKRHQPKALRLQSCHPTGNELLQIFSHDG